MSLLISPGAPLQDKTLKESEGLELHRVSGTCQGSDILCVCVRAVFELLSGGEPVRLYLHFLTDNK